jgi:ParB-like chromosome segregation protein Spo0J
MSVSVRTAFLPDIVLLRTTSLSPGKPFDARNRKDQKYQQIASSLMSVGLIEPLVVFPLGRRKYRVLDGDKRLDILAGRKVPQVECLLATVDESYTYNKRVNYLSPVGEHEMILRALKHNSVERIAEALNVDVATIRRKRNLLEGICKEAVELLKDRRATPRAFVALRKMRPLRQIEAAELMIASNKYSGRFAAALVVGTRAEMLIEPPKNSVPATIFAAQKISMENETDALVKNLKIVEASYGIDVLTLSVSCRYVNRLLVNDKVHSYLSERHPEICEELESLIREQSPGKSKPPDPNKKRGVSGPRHRPTDTARALGPRVRPAFT